MARGKAKEPIEVRRDAPVGRQTEGEIDEVCGRGFFHLERMTDSEFALMLYGEYGDTLCVWFGPKRQPKRGSAPHTRVSVSWYTTREEERRYKRDYKLSQRDPLKYAAVMKRRLLKAASGERGTGPLCGRSPCATEGNEVQRAPDPLPSGPSAALVGYRSRPTGGR